MRIDLSGIAKGYIADRALETLRGAGYRVAMVDAGGDLALGQPPPGQTGWRIGIAPLGKPLSETDAAGDSQVHYIALADCGVATSGDAARSVMVDGGRVSHLIDPRSGQPLADPWAATVIAANCMLADAYASAAMVSGTELREKLERADESLRIVMARRKGEEVEWCGLEGLVGRDR
jgi:thiamine biosynthesis lipoprotein